MSRHAPAKESIAALALACAVGALFWLPSHAVARGYFPAPLDDTFIHFDFARALAHGHPFEWIVGQGYSSGETSPLYAVMLAAGWVFGFRGRFIGVWAAMVAVVSLASLVRSMHALVRPCPAWVLWGAAAVPLSVGLVDWTLVSGMEMAPFIATLVAALVALDRSRRPTERRAGLTREQAQGRLGAWGACLCLLRPEAGVLVAIFAVLAARGARLRSGFWAFVRVAMPGALATGTILTINRIETGSVLSAGAQLKLLSSHPYLSGEDRAVAFVENLVVLFMKAIVAELGIVRWAPLLIATLAFCALASKARRVVAAACMLGSGAWALLVSYNSNAPFHNFRYYAPAIVLLLVGAALGIETLARKRRTKPLGAVALVAVIGLAAPRFPVQIRHFAKAVANIRDQQIEAGSRLAALTPKGARILVGDAGAIPFVSNRSAIDALGLGGFQRMPFARAATFGEAATLELIERLEASERPTYFALYPNWFREIVNFGVEIDRITIKNNIICAGPTKGIYRADWSALDSSHTVDPSLVDELDVADIISEHEHAYEPPLPHGGWTTLDILNDERGERRFDGGRIIPEGLAESFRVSNFGRGPKVLRIRVRVDAHAGAIFVRTRRSASELAFEPASPGAWRTASALVEIEAGERISLEAVSGGYRNYHVWIYQ
ncbi:MAG: DUF2079 domain-containing protein [Polyangiaceae bacterium]|nr:DUF2079 domain-containing protein [Polyangiaceae bacterium]